MKRAHALADVAAEGLRRLGWLLVQVGLLPQVSTAQSRLWREAGRAAGLGGVEESADGLAGWAGPLRVRLERFADRESSGTRLSISGPAMPAGLTIRPEGLATVIRGVRGAREIEVGHDTFDAAAWVEGPPALTRAVLTADNRRALRALFDGRLERPGHSPFWASGCLENGVLVIDVPEIAPVSRSRGRAGEDPAAGDEPGASAYLGGLDHLPEVLIRAIAIARQLAAPADVARRLADNLRTEPVGLVRLQCLATLAREFADHPATGEALLAASEDPDAEVRLRAAIALGPKGREVLLAIAGGEGAEDATTERAVLALGFHFTTDEAQGILRNALRTRREATARACLRALGQRRGSGVVATLAKVVAIEKPALAAVAAEALGATGDAAAEAPLVAALGSPDVSVRLAAARALGRVGTTAAVRPLKEREARDRAARAAARQAIAEIQSRAVGAAPGQLSLAGGEAGQLSLTPGEAGRLSLAGAELGELALAPGEAGRPTHTPSSRGASEVTGDEGSATPADSSGPVEPESPRMTGSGRVAGGE